jgi:hypothetical protein
MRGLTSVHVASAGHRRWSGVVAAVALAIAPLAGCGDDDAGDGTTAPTSAPVTSAPVTSAPVTSAPATAPPDSLPGGEDTTTAVWPWVESDVRYTDPRDAARGFAVDFVGFTDPIVGEFMQGDSRSGEVEVRSLDTFAPTTVFVRQLGPDDSWWVLGSATENIEITAPAALATIDSPLTLAGRSSAWEGTVDVAIRADGAAEPLYEGFVTGGGIDEMGPFEAQLDWADPQAGAGAIVLTTASSDDGRVLEAAVLRVLFG